MKFKILLIMFIILFLAGAVQAIQTFTYKIDSTGLFLVKATTNNSDIAFRYDKRDFDYCLRGKFAEKSNGEVIFNATVLNLDCKIYSLYNLIRFIRENNDNFTIVLGGKLSQKEIDAANNLSRFFKISLKKEPVSINSSLILIGNSDVNNLTRKIFGNWNYASGESIIYFENDNYLKIVLAGKNSDDTVNAVNSLINYTEYFESFKGECVLVEGCEMPTEPLNLSLKSTYLPDVVSSANRWVRGEISLKDAVNIFSLWVNY